MLLPPCVSSFCKGPFIRRENVLFFFWIELFLPGGRVSMETALFPPKLMEGLVTLPFSRLSLRIPGGHLSITISLIWHSDHLWLDFFSLRTPFCDVFGFSSLSSFPWNCGNQGSFFHSVAQTTVRLRVGALGASFFSYLRK